MIHDEVGHAPMAGLLLCENDGATTTGVAPHTARHPTTHILSLHVLTRDHDVQPRLSMSDALITDYAGLSGDGGAEALPPIIVYQDGPVYWLADGFHRVAAAQQAGLTALPAEVRAGTKREAMLFACSANKHGERLTNADKKRVALRLLQDAAWAQWSDSAIARHCGTSQPFIAKLRHTLQPSSNGSKIAAPRTVRRGHRTYTMDVSPIGKHHASPDASRAEEPSLLSGVDATPHAQQMEGWRGSDLETEAGWRKACEEARQRYHSGRFLIERLGAERFLEPQLMAILWQLRQTLVEEYGAEAPTATMLIDLAVMTYYNALRVQAWIGDLALHIEHEFFGHEGPTAKLRQKWGYQVEGLVVEEGLQRLSEQLMPLFERANRQLMRNLQALRTLRHGPPPAVAIGHAGQVNLAQQQINLTQGGRNGTGEHLP